MDLGAITPVILSYNEEPNIGRVLSRLGWAKDIVVVDSHSSDRTPEIVRSFPNTRLFTRTFDNFANQANYALRETAIGNDWVLTLDSDYVLSERVIAEIGNIEPGETVNGYSIPFRFCILGRPLPRSMLPPRVALFRRSKSVYYQDGHTQRVRVEGLIEDLREPIDHDDRKPLSRWVFAQDGYAQHERDKLLAGAGTLELPDRIRSWLIPAPLIVLFYCLIVKRLLFAGLPGWHYTYQRVLAEMLLSLYLIESRLRGRET